MSRESSTEAVTLRGVARELGVSAPSIYRHFDTREDLVAAAVAAQFDRLRSATVHAAGESGSALSRLRAGLLGYCRFAEDDPGGYAVLFSRPLPDEIPREAGSAAFKVLVDAVAAAMTEGSLPARDPLETARRVWTSLHGAVSLRTVMPQFPWNTISEAVDEVLADLGATLGPGQPE